MCQSLTILTVPSHELEIKLSLVTGFQAVAKASRLCSWKIMTGNSLMPISKSLSDPSPQATTSWFSLISDQAKSYIASFVSNLYIRHCQPRQVPSCCFFVTAACINARLLNLDTLRRQRKSKEPAVSNDAEVGSCPDGDARVVIWRVLDRVGIVPLGAELEHRGHCL